MKQATITYILLFVFLNVSILQAQKKYHVIAGSFKNPDGAKAYLNTFKSKGVFQKLILLRKSESDTSRLSVGEFLDKEEATDYKNMLMAKGLIGDDAWLLFGKEGDSRLNNANLQFSEQLQDFVKQSELEEELSLIKDYMEELKLQEEEIPPPEPKQEIPPRPSLNHYYYVIIESFDDRQTALEELDAYTTEEILRVTLYKEKDTEHYFLSAAKFANGEKAYDYLDFVKKSQISTNAYVKISDKLEEISKNVSIAQTDTVIPISELDSMLQEGEGGGKDIRVNPLRLFAGQLTKFELIEKKRVHTGILIGLGYTLLTNTEILTEIQLLFHKADSTDNSISNFRQYFGIRSSLIKGNHFSLDYSSLFGVSVFFAEGTTNKSGFTGEIFLHPTYRINKMFSADLGLGYAVDMRKTDVYSKFVNYFVFQISASYHF